MKTSTMTVTGQVTVPKELRDAFGWKVGDEVFSAYRKRGGKRTAPLPDFFIGAHALVDGLILLTRDARRYRTYFEGLRLVAPE